MRSHTKSFIAGVATVLVVSALSACTSSPQNSDEPSSSDPNATILVWTDSTRQAGFEQFQAANPDIKLDIQLIPKDIFTKLQLFNQTKSGWPDVIFDPNTNDAAQLAAKPLDYAADLTSAVPRGTQDNFGDANSVCTVDNNLVCLRNDIAPTVLWYNEPLMQQFGYELPATWEDYQKLGARVASEHPGYVLGSAGDAFTYYNYFQSSGCPIQDVTGNSVKIDMTASACTDTASMLDAMIADGSILKSGWSDPATADVAMSGKMLMTVGPAWFGDFVFPSGTIYNLPDGQMAAAAMPSLGDQPPYSGSAGGGIYVISKHTTNFEGALKLVTWMATDVDYQKDSPTFPAFAPAAEAWAEKVASSPFYASDPFDVLSKQAELVNPTNDHATRYDPAEAFTTVMTGAVRDGSTLTSALPDLQKELENLAQSAGYTIE
jgi:ABC-type glycerol-3-phosphate transport system substrate-binding protein